jgi:hypothetical protein
VPAETLQQLQSQHSPEIPQFVSLEQLAELWNLPITWLRENCRSRCIDPLPVYRMGRYVRADLKDPALLTWIRRRHIRGNNKERT